MLHKNLVQKNSAELWMGWEVQPRSKGSGSWLLRRAQWLQLIKRWLRYEENSAWLGRQSPAVCYCVVFKHTSGKAECRLTFRTFSQVINTINCFVVCFLSQIVASSLELVCHSLEWKRRRKKKKTCMKSQIAVTVICTTEFQRIGLTGLALCRSLG